MEVDLEAIRALYRGAAHLELVRPSTRRVLERLIEHDRFAGSTDPVALEVLAGIIRAARPETMLQLGTWIGYSALFLADLLVPGCLYTVDPERGAHETASAAAREAGLDNVIFVDGYSTEPAIGEQLRTAGPFPLAYVDSSHAFRETLQELEVLFGGLVAEGGLVMFHDAAATAAGFDSRDEGGVPAALAQWSDKLDTVVLGLPVFPTVCGLGLVRLKDS